MSLKAMTMGLSLHHLRKSFAKNLYSTTAATSTEPVDSAANARFRSLENNPVNHSIANESLYYRLAPGTQEKLFSFGGLTTSYEKQVKTFGELCLMVRKPALEVMEYIRASDLSRPAVRYVMFGKNGSGKTLSLAHVIHFAHESGWILFHVPWVPNWLRRPREVANCEKREGYVDLPLDAAQFLANFKLQNSALIGKLDLRVSEDREWNPRESTRAGAPLTELVDFGIARVKYACEVVNLLVGEVKRQCTAGRCRALVALDGFNSLFYEPTRIRNENKKLVPPERVTLVEALLEATKFDWCNGAVVVTVGEWAVGEDRRESYLPLYQLTRKGFEHLDPFVPVHVPEYSEKEIESCLDYYTDRRWLQDEQRVTEEGRQELKFLTGYNPYRLMVECSHL